MWPPGNSFLASLPRESMRSIALKQDGRWRRRVSLLTTPHLASLAALKGRCCLYKSLTTIQRPWPHLASPTRVRQFATRRQTRPPRPRPFPISPPGHAVGATPPGRSRASRVPVHRCRQHGCRTTGSGLAPHLALELIEHEQRQTRGPVRQGVGWFGRRDCKATRGRAKGVCREP